MPVGDSITEGGKTFHVYRPALARKLKAAGYAVEFVGSKTTASPDGPLAHEGYGGRNAEFLANRLPAALKEHPADVLLIHSGHNHTAEEKPVEKIVAATEAMVAAFRASNPKGTVLLAQVITSGKLPKYAYIPELNVALAKLAARLDKPDQRVVLVNMADGWDPATDAVADKVHPNEAGAAKMADKWFAALATVLEKPKGR
ncbi:MAG TPA: GDSL-type esterase/lipase family protein [Humisphaera sp.]